MSATGGDSAEKGHELSFRGDVEQAVMDTSLSIQGKILYMFWQRFWCVSGE